MAAVVSAPRLALWALAGGIVALGTLTFNYAQGVSYLSDDPRACANCHVMQDVFDGWNRSPHHAVAVCNDCHTPHTFPDKYLVKGLNGLNHSTRFTLNNYPTNLQITPFDAAVVQDNCVNCHGRMAAQIVTVAGHSTEGVTCARCHYDVGHP